MAGESLNLVFWDEGILAMPSRHIDYMARDLLVPVPPSITSMWWQYYRKFGFFSPILPLVPNVLLRMGVLRSGEGANEKRLWFMVLPIDHRDEDTPWEHTFGARFLWLVNRRMALRILDHVDDAAPELNADDAYAFGHLTYLSQNLPNLHMFNNRDWPGSFFLETVPCFYDRFFIMSVRPFRIEQEPSPDLSRPPSMQPKPGTAGCFRPDSVPDDVFHHFFGGYARTLLSSEDRDDIAAFHRLRLVSRAFCRKADAEVMLFFGDIGSKVGHAHRTEHLDDLIAARDFAHSVHISPIELASLARLNETPLRLWSRLRANKLHGTS